MSGDDADLEEASTPADGASEAGGDTASGAAGDTASGAAGDTASEGVAGDGPTLAKGRKGPVLEKAGEDGDSEDGDSEDGEPPGSADDETSGYPAPDRAIHGRSWTPTLVILRTVIVLVVMGILYYEIAPVTRSDHSRVSQLVPAESGLKAFPGKPKGQAIPIAQAGISSLTAAQKAQPNKTGAYQEQWGTGQGQPAIEAVVFLTGDQASAAKVTAEIAKVSLAADAESAQGFTQQSRFSVSGIDGSQGVLYGSKTPAEAATGTLAVALAHVGRYTILTEGIGAKADTQTNVESLLRTEWALVTSKGDGFSFNVTHYPQTATILWAVGTGLAVIVVGFGPAFVGSIRRRQQAARQAEIDAMVRGHESVTKRRRVQG